MELLGNTQLKIVSRAGLVLICLCSTITVHAACAVIDTSCSIIQPSQKHHFTCEAFICGNIHEQSAGWEYENGIRVSR